MRGRASERVRSRDALPGRRGEGRLSLADAQERARQRIAAREKAAGRGPARPLTAPVRRYGFSRPVPGFRRPLAGPRSAVGVRGSAGGSYEARQSARRPAPSFLGRTAVRTIQKRRALQRPDAEPSIDEEPLMCAGGVEGPVAEIKGNRRHGWTLELEDHHRRTFVSMLKNVFKDAVLHRWYRDLEDRIPWDQPKVKGRLMPRLTAFLTSDGCRCTYSYGGTSQPGLEMEPWFLELTEEVCRACGVEELPNSCNANLYEDGSHSVGWHADDEKLFEATHRDALIVSLSLGATRAFELRPHDDPENVTRLMLQDGDLCTMEGLCQKHYLHRVPKEGRRLPGPRINLTWRWVTCHDRQCPRAHGKPVVRRIRGAIADEERRPPAGLRPRLDDGRLQRDLAVALRGGGGNGRQRAWSESPPRPRQQPEGELRRRQTSDGFGYGASKAPPSEDARRTNEEAGSPKPKRAARGRGNTTFVRRAKAANSSEDEADKAASVAKPAERRVQAETPERDEPQKRPKAEAAPEGSTGKPSRDDVAASQEEPSEEGSESSDSEDSASEAPPISRPGKEPEARLQQLKEEIQRFKSSGEKSAKIAAPAIAAADVKRAAKRQPSPEESEADAAEEEEDDGESEEQEPATANEADGKSDEQSSSDSESAEEDCAKENGKASDKNGARVSKRTAAPTAEKAAAARRRQAAASEAAAESTDDETEPPRDRANDRRRRSRSAPPRTGRAVEEAEGSQAKRKVLLSANVKTHAAREKERRVDKDTTKQVEGIRPPVPASVRLVSRTSAAAGQRPGGGSRSPKRAAFAAKTGKAPPLLAPRREKAAKAEREETQHRLQRRVDREQQTRVPQPRSRSRDRRQVEEAPAASRRRKERIVEEEELRGDADRQKRRRERFGSS
eukprot:TRINITY_DN36285_c0_g1_i1.p1 TRINITY_DN36285_c0_g1~~TRINITY_DN36285_c0_g1_i1.p1  ORF type:complete len:900 (-),score=212.13 TRINITY_DN36285_c0_g1_i1:51-2750(-)